MDKNRKLRNAMKSGKPKQMIVYLCGKCGFEFGRTELHTPICSYCQAKSGFTIVKKQKLTPSAIAERLKASTDNMMSALMGAYQTRPKEIDEKELLKVMQKAKKFTQKIQKLKLKKTLNKP
jgi:DNA-directed RNA polymerase subunit RPC12/RpoP